MKTKTKLTLLLTSLVFMAGGIFVKQWTGKEAENIPGSVAGEKTNLVSSLYSDIPLYPNASISSVLEKNNTVVVSLQTVTGPETISNYYQNILLQNQWLGGPKEFTKENKKLSVDVTQNLSKTQTAVILNYSFVPTK